MEQQGAASTQASDTLTVGLPAEWELFKVKHRHFLQEIPRLKAALNLAFARMHTDSPESPADLTIFAMGRLMAEDFLELTLLAGNGYGIGCMKILRGLFERAVTLRYLHANPDEAEAFARYDYIHRGKAARRVLEDLPDYLDAEGRAKLERTVAEMGEHKAVFEVTLCKDCGRKGLNHSWNRLDVVSMARQVPTLAPLAFHCYQRALLFTHATPMALSEHMKAVGNASLVFDFEPRRAEASEALNWAHLLLLDMLNVFKERFNPAGLAETIADAEKAFAIAWEAKTEAQGPDKTAGC